MSWQLFAVIQIAAFAAAALAALWLRNRRLAQRSEALLDLCTRAHDEIQALTGKLTEIEITAPPEKLLAERIKALTGDDPLIQVRRLVLENEIDAKADFAERLAGHLAPGEESDEAEFVQRWRAVRQECQQLAMFLIADKPDCRNAIEQLFEVLAPLDEAYAIELPPLDSQLSDGAAADTALDAAAEPAADTAQADAAEAGSGDAEPSADGEELDQAALDALLEQNRQAGAA